MNKQLSLAVIYGSTRRQRRCDQVVAWVLDRIEAHGSFTPLSVDPRNDPAQQLAARLNQADAYLIVTPEYNHGYPADLKALLDNSDADWAAKPVALVSYGGISGGIRAAEQLRQVLIELHAAPTRDSVAFADVGSHFDGRSEPLNARRYEASAQRMLTTLYWWGAALKRARQQLPYSQRAA